MNVRAMLNWVGATAVVVSLGVGPTGPVAVHTFHPGAAPRAEFRVAGKSYKIDPQASSAKTIRALPPERFDPIARRGRVDQFYHDTLKDRFNDRYHDARWHCGPFRPEFIYWVRSWRAEWRARWAWHHRVYLDDLLWNEWMADPAFAAEVAALQRANAPVDPNYLPPAYAAVSPLVIYNDEYINAVYNPPPFLAVLRLKSLRPDPQSDWIADATSDSLLSNLASVPGLFLADGTQVSGALHDRKLSASDAADPTRAAQVGKAVDVERVVTGSYVADGDQVLFNLRIVNVATGAVEDGVSRTVPRDHLLDGMPGLASALAAAMGYGSPADPVHAEPVQAVPVHDQPNPASATADRLLAAAPAARRVLTSADALTGDVTYTADEGPYEIQDKLAPAEGAKKCTLHIGPGADVRGGSIAVTGGLHVEIAGTADRPAILRHVDFQQTFGGSFSARYAVFDGCTFHKTGARYAKAGFTSKWVFDNCVIRGGEPFHKITHVDYGIKWTGCTFSGVTLVDIAVPQPKDKPLDYMTGLRKDWRLIDHCSFDGCTVPPTIFWCATASNYTKCRFPTGPAFESDTPTDVVAFVADTDGDAPDKVAAATPAKRAALHIVYAPQPFQASAAPAASGEGREQ